MWKASDFMKKVTFVLGDVGIGERDCARWCRYAFGLCSSPFIVTMFYLFFWIYIQVILLRGRKSAVLYRFVSALSMRYLRVLMKFLGLKCKVLVFFSFTFKSYEERVLNEEGVEELQILQSLSQNHPHPGKFHMHTNMMAWKMHFLLNMAILSIYVKFLEG